MTARALRLALPLLAVAAVVAACSAPGGPETGGTEPVGSANGAAAEPVKVTYDDHGMPVGLHQFNPFTDKVTSGAQPEGEEAFRNLQALGFKTVVSVDGAMPDVATAKKYGLRYVHVPMQYSGVKPDEEAKLAKAVETSDGPVYIHCHHGKHRSPAATGAVCVGLGLMTPEQALAEMKNSGTDPKYEGLYRDVMNAKRLTPEQLRAVPAELPEAVKPEGIAEAMVHVDERWEHLKDSKSEKWGVPSKSPDVDPPHEARMLWEGYREIARLADAKEHGEKVLAGLTEAEEAAKELEAALRAKNTEAASTAFDRGAKACSSCHKKFRDN
jgi:protein tyrosine phosphatase (PTP) superfamily phosphohydrolase (DUF442 family)